MNRQEHLTIGVIAFLAYTYLIYLIIKISNNAIVYAFIAVVLGSIIPDILEAPTSWMHRGLGHSKRALKLTGKIFVITALIGLLSSIIYIFSIFYIISGFFLGYVFHLLADATTEVGLPD
jgi:hypothetical protein